MQHDGLLRSDVHALSIHGIESADRVADGQQAGRERLESIVVSVHALRKPKARHITQPLRVPDRVRNRRRAKTTGIGHEARRIPRRILAVATADGDDPAAALERQHQRTPAALRGGVRALCYAPADDAMCRDIKTLANFGPPATTDEIRASAL